MCLNRENRRALKKKLRDKGSRILAADVLESLGNEIDKKIRDGDLVILNDSSEGLSAYAGRVPSIRGVQP